MLPKTITSLQHPLIKHLVNLRKERSYREAEKAVILSGRKVIEEVSTPIRTLITVEPTFQIEAEEYILATESILKKITGQASSDCVAAVVDMPKYQDVRGKNYLLILDQISDPGNLGTLIRSALALGWEGIVSTPNTVDFFNDKALRAAKGATFSMPLAKVDYDELGSWGSKRDLFLADVTGSPLEKNKSFGPLALILSSESNGPSPWAKKVGKKVSIPMQNGVESLNVAAAGAILLYMIRGLS